ncbi:AMP-binding protein [Erythrobacter arachoides]|uniref:3-methylmercaptopropionyl-CoA ligase n=1 Tax=Aurantiacibacter arachoides TaxID=1850444 RepID=A0A844ZY58_9SPHN|nr:AMP-binding protein [Aurantiacibacter arachoides]MXO92140.1 AMP-binding protein [Aurantiacibacter arachoides]GGD59374.1 AMP-binding protein [Aurantiacibacter arachoides]
MTERRLEKAHCDWFADAEVLDTTIGGLLREQARTNGDAPALIEGLADGTSGRRWTYAQMFADAERLARGLATRFHPLERIAAWGPNIPEWVLLEHACALAGLVLVTVNPAYQRRELDYVLRQSGSAGLFIVGEFRGNPMADIAGNVADGIDTLREVVDMQDHAALFTDPSGTLPDVGTNDPAQIQYTSGTTGFPKGVVLSHRNLTNNARLFIAVGEMGERQVTLGLTPLFHTMGCSMGVLGALQSATAYCPLPAFDPNAALDLIERERVTWTICVPTMAVAMVAAQKAKPRDLSSLKRIGMGGAMVAPELARNVEAVLGAQALVAYGQTESSPLITTGRPSDSVERITTTIGQPAAGCEVAIVDPATGEIMSVDTVGEIRSRSASTMLGYHENPEATAEVMTPDGWLCTGDLGTMDDQGYVKITGRVRDMIIRGGENLFPAEIENVLLEHPSVAECAVVGVPDPVLGEAVAAWIRVAEGESYDPEVLRGHVRSEIAAQKCPAHWQQVSEWPLTGSGKIQKFKLRDAWLAERGGEG